jgi:hypothetical protein
MDKEFLSQRLKVIFAKQVRLIYFEKEQEYYRAYAEKLRGELFDRVHFSKDMTIHTGYVDSFQEREIGRTVFSWFYRPKNMIKLVCEDAKDVLKSMERFEGVEKYDPNRLYGIC